MDDVIYNCDWLQYSVMLAEDSPELFCPDGFRVEVMSGNNIFRYRALVFDEKGRKWLTLMWSPYSALLNKRIMTIQVGNELLYSSAIQQSFRVLQEIVECTFNSMGRIDICCDFVASDKQIQAIKHLNSGAYYVQGKSEGSNWWHNTTKGGRWLAKQNHCLTWGKQSSEIKVKLYHKSREQGMLTECPSPEKPYIVSQWEQRHWDVTRVWRLEFSMCGSGQLRWQGQNITIDNVASCEWIASVFRGLYAKRFVVRKNQGKRKGHKNGDELVRFLSLDGSEEILKWAETNVDRVPVSEGVHLLRTMMNSLSSPVVACSYELTKTYATAIYELVEVQQLRNYFRNHFGGEVDDVLSRAVENSGSQIVEVDANPKRVFL